jgi:hypothetical protein
MNPELNELTKNMATLTQLTKDHISSDEKFQEMILENFEKISEKLDPIVEAYGGVVFGKKLLVGVGAAVLAIAAIGGGVMYIVNFFRNV